MNAEILCFRSSLLTFTQDFYENINLCQDPPGIPLLELISPKLIPW